jgi:5-methylcytosine-specific restriction endonuclease McrA
MRDEAKCRLCGAAPSDGAKLQVDHIVPWSKGGATVLTNLQILCEQCNIGKSDLS